MRHSDLDAIAARTYRLFRLIPATLSLLTLVVAFHASASAQCPPQMPPQSAPTLTGSPNKAGVNLSWSAVDCADRYAISRSDDGGTPYYWTTVWGDFLGDFRRRCHL